MLTSAVKGAVLVPVNACKAPEGEREGGKIRFYQLVAAQKTFESELLGANRFCCRDSCPPVLGKNATLLHHFF